MCLFFFFFFKQKTAYEMRISDWSSDVCSSDLFRPRSHRPRARFHQTVPVRQREASASLFLPNRLIVRRRKLTDFAQARLDMFDSGLFGQGNAFWRWIATDRSEEHTYELQSLRRISYAVFCLKNKYTIQRTISRYPLLHF